ncbi:pentatricopeptide repeat-containing protein DOT4, chloroplastic [Euphorbia lathyris]|uniref:pentatricopeptide repeat-containing protein DOT4, chloroplastic n=1 Tax=Euphorbia lathyris TaxID=212925 RepID=UPI0033142C63
MLISIAETALPKFFVSPQNNARRETSQNALLFNRLHSRSTLSSNLHICYTVLPVSLSFSTAEEHKISDCNRKISKLCELGNLRKAMELLDVSPVAKIESSTYCEILQLCADNNSLKDGKHVHSIISSSGISIHGALGAKLVFMYVTCGNIREGRLIFDQIANEKVFLWNLMLSGYAKIGDFEESVYLFRRMLDLGIEVNSHTFSCILKCYATLGSLKEGECVHGYLLKLRLASNTFVVNSLISFYFKIGKVQSAQKVFDEMSDRDIISWNSMISGCVSSGMPEKGLRFFQEMRDSEVSIDLATMVNVLAACSNCDDVIFGRAVHAFAIKARLDQRLTFANTLLDMYSKCGDLDDAIRVFEKMGERSVVSWTSLIAGYAREGKSGEAIRLFRDMESEGVRPDIFTITVVLHACACNGSLEDGKEIHNYIKENNMQSNLFVCNSLMDMYAKCGSMEEANSVFLEMPVRDIISWNTMIGGASKNGFSNEALTLFASMVRESKPDGRTVACTLPACASLAALDRGREIHGYVLRNCHLSDQPVANALLDMYVKCGAIPLAETLFDMIPVKDLISWTVMIAGYGMHGLGKEAIATFNEMRQAGTEPDEISFVSVLYSCSHSGLLDEGWRFFNIMQQECHIEPKLEHYACMVDLLARTGKLSTAYKFIKSMPIEPDSTIWGSLLSGCRIHHDVKLAEKVAEHIFELEPENTGYYVLLANIYAEAETWEEVKKLREKISQQGLKKNPGCSWIEAKGQVHVFVAGDSSHAQATNIEQILKRLRSRIKEEGYFPQMKYAMTNADDMEKEMALCGHSEKLAMAFGILNLPPGKTMRITKNLRVCGDCHEMAKFVSTLERREIIMRDSSRFHHFKDGTCSCRGFW